MIVNNYRPISLLSIFNQLLEKIVSKRLTFFINLIIIIFCIVNSLVSVLSILLYRLFFQLLIKFQKVLRIENIHVGYFWTCQKHTVNHNILLHYGIRGVVLRWFQSYLENRKQFVSIGNVRSDISYISCGVPRGSVLGPFLFLLCLIFIILLMTLVCFILPKVYQNYNLSTFTCTYRDYFMVGECVRFLFTSCEGSLNERVSAANE